MNKLLSLILYPSFTLALISPLLADESSDKSETYDHDSYVIMTGDDVSRSISAAEKKQYLTPFKKEAKSIKMPQEMVNAVTLDTLSDQVQDLSNHDLGDMVSMYFDEGLSIVMFTPKGKDPIIMLNRYKITKDDVANPIPKSFSSTNPLTKEPYFSMDKSLKSKLKDAKRTLKIHEVLSSNFSAIMGIASIDKRKFESGEYLGKILHFPKLTFDRQPPTLPSDIGEEELKIRALLGYYIGDIVHLNQDLKKKLSFSPFPFQPSAGGWNEATVSQGVSYDVHSADGAWVYCINDTKYYEDTKYGFMRRQIKEKSEYLQKLLDGFQAITDEAGIDRSNPDAELSPDQELIAGWCNALERYVLILNSMDIKEMTDPELEKLKTLASYIGKENTKPIASGEAEKIENWGKKLKKKREPWNEKELKRKQKVWAKEDLR